MRSQRGIQIVLAGWATIMIVIGASLMAGHWIPLPSTAPEEGHLPGAADGRWRVYHFLYMECPCSRRVLEHICQRQAVRGMAERLVLIGNSSDLPGSARREDCEVDWVTPQELETEYGVESAPMMVVVDPKGRTRYSGGYTSRKQVLDIQDREIMDRLLAEEEVDALPVFGCAVSRQLQSITDPFGLKYEQEE
jgi:hypothetical protein